MAPKPHYLYAVAVGHTSGIYESWEACKAQVEGYMGARYKKFLHRAEAEAFIKGNGSVVLGQMGIKMTSPSPSPVAVSPHSTDTIVVFTDGSALSNGRKNARAGYAVVFPHHPEYTMAAPLPGPNPTNNRAEYTALLKALQIVESIDPTRAKKLVVYTDSKLLLQSVTQWIKGWKKNGWRKSDGAPVLNRDLLEAIDMLAQQRKMELHHVLAHTGREDWKSKWNEKADVMARDAAAASSHA